MAKQDSWKASPLALSRRSANLLLLLGVPVLLLHLIDFAVQSADPSQLQRDVFLLDAFSGHGALSQTYSSNGLKSSNFDILTQGSEGNILDMYGFCSIIRKLLQVVPHGLMLGGPPCGSWVFINSGTSRRSRHRLFGDTKKAYVKDANTITCRWVLLGLIAAVRSVLWITEQPRSSLMTLCPYVRYAALALYPASWDDVKFPMGAYRHRSTKPTVLFGTAPWLQKLYRKMTKKDKRRISTSSNAKGKEMVIKSINKKTGKPSVRGGPGPWNESFSGLYTFIFQGCSETSSSLHE